jgi:hypothetical protein
MATRQVEIPLTTQYYFSIPATVKGRIVSTDFIHFDFDSTFPNEQYDVVIEGFDGQFKIVGSLQSDVILPHIQIPYNSTLLVIPKSNLSQPGYVGTVMRGKTYAICPTNSTLNGWKILK